MTVPMCTPADYKPGKQLKSEVPTNVTLITFYNATSNLVTTFTSFPSLSTTTTPYKSFCSLNLHVISSNLVFSPTKNT